MISLKPIILLLGIRLWWLCIIRRLNSKLYMMKPGIYLFIPVGNSARVCLNACQRGIVSRDKHLAVLQSQVADASFGEHLWHNGGEKNGEFDEKIYALLSFRSFSKGDRLFSRVPFWIMETLIILQTLSYICTIEFSKRFFFPKLKV